MKSNVLIASIVTGLIFFTGCAWLSDKTSEKPAEELAQDGMQAFEDGEYREAIKNFEQLRDWFPFNRHSILAELKIADAHYELAEYEEAIVAYREFEQLHPRNEAIAYAIYQIGRCYYDRIDTVDRDQTPALKALETFQRLIQQLPDDTYAKQARTHILKCYQSLAGHEFYVGRFYFKNKNYKAALQRFKGIISDYPDTGVHLEAMKYIAECETRLAHSKPAEQDDPPQSTDL